MKAKNKPSIFAKLTKNICFPIKTKEMLKDYSWLLLKTMTTNCHYRKF